MKHEMIGERRQSRFDPHLAERIEAWDRELTLKEEAEKRRRELEARLNPKAAEPDEVKPAEEAKVASGSRYALMDRADTYALGMQALREACETDSNCVHPTFVKKDGSVVYRPLTFEENIRARLDDYYTLENPDGSKRGDEERLRLFWTRSYTCTGIAYKKGSTLFKIITESEDLIGIPQNFSDNYIPANYSQLQGIELDSDKGKYNESLTKKQVLKHPAWTAAVADQSLLKDYADFVLRWMGETGCIVHQNPEKYDILQMLFVYDISNSSYACGISVSNYLGQFVRVTHRAPQAP